MRGIVVALLLLLCATPAMAHHHHYYHHRGTHYARHHHHRYDYVYHRTGSGRIVHDDPGPNVAAAKADGEPWCGAWMADHLHIVGQEARNLWLARNWSHYGSAANGPDIGVIVVWPHHVGVITGGERGHWLVTSGNSGGWRGHRYVTEHIRSMSGVIAFRRPA